MSGEGRGRDRGEIAAAPPRGARMGGATTSPPGGPRPRSDSRHHGATLQAAFGPLIGHQMVRPGGPTLMGTGPPPGGTVPAVWERAGLATQVTRGGTAVFGTKASAGARPLLDQVRPESLGMTHITPRLPTGSSRTEPLARPPLTSPCTTPPPPSRSTSSSRSGRPPASSAVPARSPAAQGSREPPRAGASSPVDTTIGCASGASVSLCGASAAGRSAVGWKLLRRG